MPPAAQIEAPADAALARHSAVRTVYAKAADPESSFPDGRLVIDVRAALRGGHDAAADRSLRRRRRDVASWARAESARFEALLERVTTEADRGVLARHAVLGCAPLALCSGAWLQWLTGPGNADDATSLRMLALYAADVGVGRPGASRGDAYRDLMSGLQVDEHASTTATIAFDQRVPDESFDLPALLLVMSRRPDDFRHEILGADLCLREVGLLPALTPVRRFAAADWAAIDPSAERPDLPSPAGESAAIAEALIAEDGADRVLAGFDWALAAVRGLHRTVYARLDAARDPAYDMAELVRRRAPEGMIYHHDYRLGPRTLSAMLSQSRTDPGPLLHALATSRLVRPGDADASPLVTDLVGERGPMFRVFSPNDLAVIRRWIDSLPPVREETPAWSFPPAVRPPATVPARLLETTPAGGRPPADLRDAYHLLQRRTHSPELREYALGYVRAWLGRSRYAIDRDGPRLPARWPATGLAGWLSAEHARHAEEFENDSGTPLPSREELIESTVQQSPLTLIDGAWLQGFTDYDQASGPIGHRLFATYWDELGNGVTRLNHPLIYREVLAEMGVRLPATASREFARWPGFREESFELPVYWLCVGRFPRTFLPELLGLNLAMELSGVGGSYRRARLALQAHGFSTRFVDIHNTIDNVATGHAAWAAEAVDAYMSALPPAQGSGAAGTAWERVRAGYRSLDPPGGLRARWAARRTRRLEAKAANNG
jgi:hypothetical protein